MRLQDIGSAAVYETIRQIPVVQDTVGKRIRNKSWLADQNAPLPACLHYSEPGGGGYADQPIGVRTPYALMMRYVVRFLCDGESTDPVDPAADAVFAALAGRIDCPIAGYEVQAVPLEPWPQLNASGMLGTGAQGRVYSEAGDYFQITVLNQRGT